MFEHMHRTKMLRNIIALFVVLFSCSGIAYAFSDKDAENAAELYEKADKKYQAIKYTSDEGTLLNIEKLLINALSLVPEDSPQLRYEKVESVLLRHGRWSEFENVIVTKTKKYYPSRLIGKIRAKIPPQLWATASLICRGLETHVQIMVINKGKTRLENLKVSIKGNFPAAPTKTIRAIMPGKAETLQWKAKKQLSYNSLTIQFQEKYGFVPCPLLFER